MTRVFGVLGLLLITVVSSAFGAIIWEEGFENGIGGWTVQGSNACWDVSAPIVGRLFGPASAFKGTNCAGTRINQQAPANKDSYFISPAIDLSGQSTAILRYHQIVSNKWNSWGCMLYVSTNMITWDKVEMFLSPSYDEEIVEINENVWKNNHPVWELVTANLSEYAGKSIYIGFRFHSNPWGSPVSGWTIDDLSIDNTPLPAAGSGIGSVHPNGAAMSGVSCWTLQYYLETEMVNCNLYIDIPSDWSPPSLTPTAAGYIRAVGYDGVVIGSPALIGNKVRIPITGGNTGDRIEIIYGDMSGGGPGAQAPATQQAYTFMMASSVGMNAPVFITTQPIIHSGVDASFVGSFWMPNSVVRGDLKDYNGIMPVMGTPQMVYGSWVRIQFSNAWTPPQLTNTQLPGYFEILTGLPGLRIDPPMIDPADPYSVWIYIEQSDFMGGGITFNYKHVTAPTNLGRYYFPMSIYTPGMTGNPRLNGQDWTDIIQKSGQGFFNISGTNQNLESGTEHVIEIFTRPKVSGSNIWIAIDITNTMPQPQTSVIGGANYSHIDYSRSPSTTGPLQVATIPGYWRLECKITNYLGGMTNVYIHYGTGVSGSGVIIPAPGNYIFRGYTKASNELIPYVPMSQSESRIFHSYLSNGSGVITYLSPRVIIPGKTNTINYTIAYKPQVDLSGGQLRITVPAEWPAPQTGNSLNSGYISSSVSGSGGSLGTPVIAGGGPWTVTWPVVNCTPSHTVYIKYYENHSLPTSIGSFEWTVASAVNGGSLTPLASGSPIMRVAPSGTGTCIAQPSNIIANTTTNYIQFTYTADYDLTNALFSITRASPIWSAFQLDNSTLPGYIKVESGIGSPVLGEPILLQGGDELHIVMSNIKAGDTMIIHYSNVTADVINGQFNVQVSFSNTIMYFQSIQHSPVIQVYAPLIIEGAEARSLNTVKLFLSSKLHWNCEHATNFFIDGIQLSSVSDTITWDTDGYIINITSMTLSNSGALPDVALYSWVSNESRAQLGTSSNIIAIDRIPPQYNNSYFITTHEFIVEYDEPLQWTYYTRYMSGNSEFSTSNAVIQTTNRKLVLVTVDDTSNTARTAAYLDISTNGIRDIHGNFGGPYYSKRIDDRIPPLVIGDAAVVDATHILINFSEPMGAAGISDFYVDGHAVTAVLSGVTSMTLTVMPNVTYPLPYVIAYTTITDIRGNALTTNSNQLIIPGAPIKPLWGPVTGLSENAFVLNWIDSNNETNYHLKVSNTITGALVVDVNLTADTITFPVGGLTTNTRYYAKLYAENTSGASATIITNIQTLVPLPSDPVWAGVSGIATNAFTISWIDSIGEYLYRYTMSNNTTGVIEDDLLLAADTVNRSHTGLTTNTVYTVKLFATNVRGVSATIQTNIQTIVPPPEAPALIWVSNCTTNTAHVLWHTSYAAYYYQWTYSNITAGGAAVIMPLAASDATNNLLTGLDINSEYSVSVYASNDSGASTTVTTNFRTLLPVPASPTWASVSSLTTNSFTLNWNDNSSYETNYHLTVSQVSSGATIIDSNLAANSTTFTVNGLVTNTLYLAVLIAENTSGASVPISNYITTPPGAGNPPTDPTWSALIGIGTNAFTVSWNDSGLETNYHLTVSNTVSGVLAADVNLAADTVTHSVSGLQTNTLYAVKLYAENTSGVSATIETNVRTELPLPATPTWALVTVSTGSFSIAWNASYAAYRYRIIVTNTNTSAEISNIILPFGITNKTITGLQSGVVYSVILIATNPTGAAAPANKIVQTISLIIDPVTTVYAYDTPNDTGTSVTVLWTVKNTNTSFSNYCIYTNTVPFTLNTYASNSIGAGLAARTTNQNATNIAVTVPAHRYYYFAVVAVNQSNQESCIIAGSATTHKIRAVTNRVIYNGQYIYADDRDISIQVNSIIDIGKYFNLLNPAAESYHPFVTLSHTGDIAAANRNYTAAQPRISYLNAHYLETTAFILATSNTGASTIGPFVIGYTYNAGIHSGETNFRLFYESSGIWNTMSDNPIIVNAPAHTFSQLVSVPSSTWNGAIIRIAQLWDPAVDGLDVFPATNLSKLLIIPNPGNPSREPVTIKGIPERTHIDIYTSLGEQVASIDAVVTENDEITMRIFDTDGNDLQSGIYLVVVTDQATGNYRILKYAVK